MISIHYLTGRHFPVSDGMLSLFILLTFFLLPAVHLPEGQWDMVTDSL